MPTMPTTLAQAVEEAVQRIYGPIEADDAETRHVRDPERLREAQLVEPIAQGFARAEADPTDKGLGIYGANMIPALGSQLGKKIAAAGDEGRDATVDAIKHALAAGYVGFMSSEPGMGITALESPDLRHGWKLTVTNFRAKGLRNLGFADEFCKTIETLAGDAMVAGLTRAGLLGWRKGRVGMIGWYYGHAGGWMRVGQTDLTLPPQVNLIANSMPDKWPFDEYVAA